MDEKQLLKKLLATEHLNVPERKSLPEPIVRREMLTDIIIEELKANGCFPEKYCLEDEFCGGLIVVTPDGKYKVYGKSEVGMLKTDIVLEIEFSSALEAATEYLRFSYSENNIDGIPFE